MKKPFFLHAALLFIPAFLILLSSCKKINEATLLGGGLVPEVDNINTFDTTFDTQTDNKLLIDTSKSYYNDPVALGNIANDPEFGATSASVFFEVVPSAYGRSPFANKSAQIDSVVLSLGYLGGYGDTAMEQTVRVYEIAQTSSFNDTTYYPFYQEPFETTGSALGAKSFTMRSLHDSVTLIRKGDTSKVANQLRITLDPALGARLAAYDSATAYGNDTLFKRQFRGFALKVDEGTGNGLAYFSLANTTATQLIVYYRVNTGTTIDTTEAVFTHSIRAVTDKLASKGGQANIIKRQRAGNWATYLENGVASDDKLYLQSMPEGSAGYITIPGLDSIGNKLIHRAELIVPQLGSESNSLFPEPGQLFVDRVKPGSDSAFLFPEFLVNNGSTISYRFNSFGGALNDSDNAYHFNVTKVVQDIATGRLPNQTLRVYAPFHAWPYNPAVSPATPTYVQAILFPAYGRVVVGGGSQADRAKRLRLRVVYSRL